MWKKFNEFIQYLEKNYFSNKSKKITAAYPNYLWNYYADIRDFGDFNTTSNAAEVVNRKLKNHCTTGVINFHKACSTLQKFKTDYIIDKERAVGQGNLNKRKRKTLNREDEILYLVREFDHQEGTFTFELNYDTIVVDFARKLGMVGKDPECDVRTAYNL